MRKFLFALLLALVTVTPAMAYTIKPGDTLWGLYGKNWRMVAQENNISDPRKLAVGTVLHDQGLVGSILGATAAIPNSPALIDTYLASGISAVDTSMTLANGTTRAGTTLSGYTCFTLDVNTPVVEYVCGTASGTAVTGLLRGVDLSNPNTTSSALRFPHRRFASVQISDYPTLPILARILQGLDSTPGGITFGTNTIYFSGTSFAIRQSGSNLQWSLDGFANSYNFTSTSITQLTASTTQGIQVVSSQIGVNASTTQGMAFGSDGKLYQKTSSTLGVYADSNGISINTSTLSGLFTSFPNAATSTPTANKIVMSTAGSSTISAGWIATSTNGYFLQSTSTGSRYVSHDNLISSSTYTVSQPTNNQTSATVTTTIPANARYAIIKGSGTSASNGGYGGSEIYFGGDRLDRNISNIVIGDHNSGNSGETYLVNITWNNSTIDIFYKQAIAPSVSGGPSGSGVIYFYD